MRNIVIFETFILTFTFLYLCLLKVCVSYNIDVSHARVLRGPRDSLFGYTTVFQRTPEGYKLMVGAPKGNNERRNGTGVAFKCDVSGSLICTQEYTIRDPNYPEKAHYGTWFSDSEMYGSVITQTINSTLVVCAPGFKDLSGNFPFMIGRCVRDERDLRPLFGTKQRNYYGNVWIGGKRNQIMWNAMGECGLSGDSLADGSVVLGVPGIKAWRGGVVLLTSGNPHPTPSETSLSTPEYSYIGYSVVSGNFCGKKKLCFAVGGPGSIIGQVYVYKYFPRKSRLKLIHTVDGDEPWSYFGASLCAADVNGDGLDDLLVGSPFYTDVDDGRDNSKKIYVDKGRVTLYINDRKSAKRTTFTKSRVLLKGSNQHNARFGTAIANIGDANKDGYEDVAIGAPCEDQGRGAVYIYHGSKEGLNPGVKQRILGRDINAGVTSFGWSISKPADIDDNTYHDFAVGNYLSDSVVILRTRPLVNLQVTMETKPHLIIRSPCPSKFDSDSCFQLQLCFGFSGVGLPNDLELEYTLKADTLKQSIDQKRVKLNSKQGLVDTISDRFKATIRKPLCKKFQAVTINVLKTLDPFTVVRMEAKYRLHLPEGPTTDIQPVLNQSGITKTVNDTAFQLACGKDNQCWSDLVIEVKSRVKNENDDVIRKELRGTIVINATDSVVVDVVVRNRGEDAFATVIYVSWTGIVRMQTTRSPPHQPIMCDGETEELDSGTSRSKCDILFPIQANTTFEFQSVFAVNDIDTVNELPSAAISISLKTGSNETNPDDNTGNVTFPVRVDTKTGITGISVPKQILVQIDKPAKVELQYMYVIRNNGPSFLPSTDVSIELPYFMPDGTRLVEDVTITIILEDNPAALCQPYNDKKSHQGIVTTEPSGDVFSEKGTTVYIPPNEPVKLNNGNRNRAGSKVVIMNCEGYRCEEFVCALHHLPPEESAVVNVSIQIPSRRLPFDDDVYIKYYTTATLREPDNPLVYPWGHTIKTQVLTFLYPVPPPGKINLFILLGSVVGGLLILLLLFILLWQCGFFKREKRYKVEEWKRKHSKEPGMTASPEVDTTSQHRDE